MNDHFLVPLRQDESGLQHLMSDRIDLALLLNDRLGPGPILLNQVHPLEMAVHLAEPGQVAREGVRLLVVLLGNQLVRIPAQEEPAGGIQDHAGLVDPAAFPFVELDQDLAAAAVVQDQILDQHRPFGHRSPVDHSDDLLAVSAGVELLVLIELAVVELEVALQIHRLDPGVAG